MGRHEKKDNDICPDCEHEAHEEGRCYHCGIFPEKHPADNPCTANLGKDD